MAEPYKIEIADDQDRKCDHQPLIAAVAMILTEHQFLKSEISIAIVDDPAIRAINKQYLNHDYETDVISFVLEFEEDPKSLCGQLVVSTDTAHSNGEELGVTMQDELLLYVVHGTLHLVGFDDKDPHSASEMRKAEKKFLSQFGVEHRWIGEDDQKAEKAK